MLVLWRNPTKAYWINEKLRLFQDTIRIDTQCSLWIRLPKCLSELHSSCSIRNFFFQSDHSTLYVFIYFFYFCNWNRERATADCHSGVFQFSNAPNICANAQRSIFFIIIFQCGKEKWRRYFSESQKSMVFLYV